MYSRTRQVPCEPFSLLEDRHFEVQGLFTEWDGISDAWYGLGDGNQGWPGVHS